MCLVCWFQGFFVIKLFYLACGVGSLIILRIFDNMSWVLHYLDMNKNQDNSDHIYFWKSDRIHHGASMYGFSQKSREKKLR